MAPGSLSYSEDLPLVAALLTAGLVLLSLVLLTLELRHRRSHARLVWLSGLLSTLSLAVAVLRPTRLIQDGLSAPARVVVLVDGSHRMKLPSDDSRSTRAQVAQAALGRLVQHWPSARLEVLRFGEGNLTEIQDSPAVLVHSDLSQALTELLAAPGEKPRAIVVLSDGRLSSPGEVRGRGFDQDLRQLAQGVPVHTVRIADQVPPDWSIRQVGTTGTALAHQPFQLDVRVGCEPVTACVDSEVVVSELIEGREPQELSRGVARREGDELRLSLEVTLERAGARVIEVGLAESRDQLPHNDRRLLPIQVRRDRTRLLHVAGRPTYDVRALRQFLKSDESIDLISFFILRTEEDDVRASQDELALIPFPVEELFTDHLPSFDAIVLQDIDARRYRLDRHFSAIRRYVLSGGGLILVGGPSGFSAGGYANSPIEEVLPVVLPAPTDSVKEAPFVPLYTPAGRAAPVLWGLRDLMSETLPEMSGANRLGPAKAQALVLWEHPDEPAAGASSAERMPLLALAEVGDGRSIALAVDGTHKLRFGRAGARAAGEGHGALWEGLLGWLMRDPRFEAARPRLEGPCIVGYPTRLSVNTLPGEDAPVRLAVTPLRGVSGRAAPPPLEPIARSGQTQVFELAGLEPGGYAARVHVGSAPPTRFVFACEVGGEAHADSRPDPARMSAIAKATSGVSVKPASTGDLPAPPPTFVTTRRSTRPLAPPWVWTTVAALFLGVHWIIRRSSGFS